MIKRYLAILILIAVFTNSPTIQVFANNTDRQTELEEKSVATVGEIGGYLKGNIETVNKLAEERRFFKNPKGGHGFAAERANNLMDRLKGKNAIIVGDDNAKNGPDRKIINHDGTVTFIQSKYYATASESVAAAFDEETGLYKYLDAEGEPMQLEVAADQYEKAVESMARRIEEGKVSGITDPKEASKIVRKGNLTYQQAVNLTKAGTIDSLKYDAANGTITAVSAIGISFVLNFALCKLNGQDTTEALKNASLDGLKTGGVVFATYVISSQLAKTGLASAMVPTAEAIANSLGTELSKTIMQVYGIEAAELTSEQITSRITGILQSQIITAGVLTVALSADDIVNLFRGRISKEQLLQNLVVTVTSVGGTYVGAVAGGAVGSLIVPGAGTAVGSFAGGALGGTAAGFVVEKGIGAFFKSDSDEMYEIISAKFESMCSDYLISKKEADGLVDTLKNKLSGSILKDMYQSENREKFAEDLMKPLFKTKVAAREKIEIPTEEETRLEMLSMLDGIVFVH